MLQTLREKQKPLLIIVFALIVISFVFLTNAGDTGFQLFGSQNDPLARAYEGDRAVYEEEALDMRRQLEMLRLLGMLNVDMRQLGAPPEFVEQQQLIGQFFNTLTQAGPTPLTQETIQEGAAARNQWVNLLAMRAQAKAAGIQFTEEEHSQQISVVITRLPALYNRFQGSFDDELLKKLKATQLRGSEPMILLGDSQIQLSNYGQNSMALLREVAADLLTFEALVKLIKPAGSTTLTFLERGQNLALSQSEVLVLEGKQEDFLPSEEEIDEALLSSWYEQNSEQFDAPESRKVELFIAKVAQPSSTAEATDDLLTDDTEELSATPIADEDWNELRNRFIGFYNEAVSSTSSQTLGEAAKEAGLEVLEVSGVNRENPPELFAANPRLLNLALNASTDPERLAEPVLEDRSRGQIITLRVLEVTPPQPRKLEEVRERVLPLWSEDLAQRNLAGALLDAAARMETTWSEEGNLNEFQPADTRLSISAPRYFDSNFSRQYLLSQACFEVPVGKATAVVDIFPEGDLNSLDVTMKKGIGFVTARRIKEENLPQMEEVPRDAINLIDNLMVDWLQQARTEQEVRLPTRRQAR